MREPNRRKTPMPPDTRVLGGSAFVEDVQRRHSETTLPDVLSPEMERDLRTAGRKAKEWTTRRDQLVRDAVAAGGSLREVGAAVGLTHTAVKFIAHGRSK